MMIPQSSRVATCFSAVEVLAICKRFVYPPCKKLSDLVQLEDLLASDLGYVDKGTGLLALKTNEAFQMRGLQNFSILDFCVLQTVQDHVLAICTKLARMRRLICTGRGD